MPRLDDPSTYRDCDPSRMLQTALDLPRQIRDAWQIGRTAALGRLPGPPAHVVAVGMGGSAIGGDLLAAALGERLALPLVVVRDSRLPAYVGQRSLVVATSYSGETEETLAAAAEACRAGAALLAITSGGRLAARRARLLDDPRPRRARAVGALRSLRPRCRGGGGGARGGRLRGRAGHPGPGQPGQAPRRAAPRPDPRDLR